MAASLMAFAASPSSAQLTLKLQDYAEAPMTGHVNGPSSNAGTSAYLARLNFMAEEPGVTSNRFFVNDLTARCTSWTKHEELHAVSEFQRTRRAFRRSADRPHGHVQGVQLLFRIRQRVHHIPVRSGLREERQVLTVHMESPSVLPGNNGPDNVRLPG